MYMLEFTDKMNDYYWQDERLWRQRDAVEKPKPLSVTLKKYSLVSLRMLIQRRKQYI